MEIRLTGKEAGIILVASAVQAAIGCFALRKWKDAEKRADDAELKAAVYDLDRAAKGVKIKILEKEIAKLKSKCKGKES